MTNMKLIARVVASIATIVAVLFAAIEVRHDFRFGHFVGPGLHADYSVSRVDLSIPGITKANDATLTNFGFLPRKIYACESLTDAMAHQTALPYAIQKWDGKAQTWNTVLEPTGALFCKPYPLGIIEGKMVEKRLWPSQNLSIGQEAMGARFQKGDMLRFVIFASEPWIASSGYPTVGFEIDEQLATTVPMRVKH